MPIWDRFITDRDRSVFAAAGYGQQAGIGNRPVLLVIDVNYAFCGDGPTPILESVKRWPHSCGEAAWDSVRCIERLLAAARAKEVPVVYTTGDSHAPEAVRQGRWIGKNRRRSEDPPPSALADDIVEAISPRTEDLVIRKLKPSAFFGTALLSYLIDISADSLLIVGGTTSGCVRATVVDAFSYNYRVAIVEEGTFDRGEASHALSLFDLNAKYADVVSLPEARKYIDGIAAAELPRIARGA